MADGVFNRNFGDDISSALMLGAQLRAKRQAAQQQMGLDQQKLRADVIGRMTLRGPGGAPAPAASYLEAINKGTFPDGMTAEPTGAYTAGVHANTAQEGTAAKNHAELTKNLAKYDTSKWGQKEYATYYEKGELPPGVKPIEKPAAGGKGGTGADPRLANLKAQEKTAKDEFEAAVKKIKDNTLYHQGDHDALSQKQAALADIRKKMQALQENGGAAGGAGAGDSQFDDLYKKHGLK
jgi:hypothetical protein